VLQKYLNANDQDVVKATDQLTKTLEWRAKMKPLGLLDRKFARGKFAGLGFVTVYGNGEGKGEIEVFTWNIYGGVENVDETFGDLAEYACLYSQSLAPLFDTSHCIENCPNCPPFASVTELTESPRFIAWRVTLMELALQNLSLSTATTPLAANPDTDPYKITQVHDYRSISFLRQSAAVKSASQETIKVFAQNYPELLKEKFFVNVPALMGFMYELIKRFVAERTRRRFHPMSNGGALAREFGASKVVGLGEMLPVEYGGKGKDLAEIGKEPLLE
jgi:phosphatidylinositol transfer protein SFH5